MSIKRDIVIGLLVILAVIALIFVIVWGVVALINVTTMEGVVTTVTGSVQLHQLSHNKFLRMDVTDIELRTYSGDTHHVALRGHITGLEYGKTYRITWVKVDYFGHLFLTNDLIEIVELETPEDGLTAVALTCGGCRKADLNKDGFVGIDDIVICAESCQRCIDNPNGYHSGNGHCYIDYDSIYYIASCFGYEYQGVTV